MNTNKKTPKLRFKGFTDDWEQRKLNDFGIATGGTSIESEFVDGGTYKVINIGSYSEESVYNDQGLRVNKTDKTKSRILNKYDLTMILNDKTASGNIIGRVLLIDQDNTYVYNQRTERIEVDTKNFLPMFLYHMLNAPEQRKYIVKASQGNTQIYVNWSTISNIDYMIPQLLLEQEKIANLFSLINKDITLHQRKLEKLKLNKSALLQKLFPQKGCTIPDVRFKGFTDAWEQREFSDIFAEVKSGLSRMLSNDDIGLPVVRANNINDGQLNLVDDIKYWYKNDPQGANTNNYLIEQGDILINFINSEAKMGTAAYVTRRPERDTIYTTNILRCKVNDEYNPYFIYSLTFLNSYKNYIASITKPAVNQASFTTVDFKKYSIKIPTVKEQNQIADLIKTFNKLITLHQRKLDCLISIKKGLLQQLFV